MPALLSGERAEPATGAAVPGPEQGVIEEARRRQRSRRLRVALLAGVVIGALGGAGFLARGGATPPEGPLHLPPEPAPSSPAALLHSHPASIALRLFPNLEGAQAGWCIQVIQLTQLSESCAPLPTDSTPLLLTSSGGGAGERDETTVAVTAPGVFRVRFSDGRTVETVSSYNLPYGLRVAVFRSPHAPEGARPKFIAAVAAFDRHGRQIPERRVLGSGLPWHTWNRPAAPAHGACELRIAAGYDATPEWGQVATRIRAYPATVLGRAFLSCIDTEYYLPGRGMRASVLLDAAHPDRALPALIPGLAPVPGLPGVYNSARSYGFQPVSARRQGQAWVVVVGGGRNAEEARIRLLRHLTASVSL